MAFTSLMPFIAIFVLFYFLLIRPQRREQARRQAMLARSRKRQAHAAPRHLRRRDQRPPRSRRSDDQSGRNHQHETRLTLSSVARVLGDEPSDETANNNCRVGQAKR